MSRRALDLFQQLGGDLTEPRKNILEALTPDVPVHPDDLWRLLRDAHPNLGRATVFRTLRLLQDMGLIERCELPGGGHAYRLCLACGDGHHHHLRCVACGRDTTIRGDALRAMEEALARTHAAYAHVPVWHDVQLLGRCPDCAQASGDGADQAAADQDGADQAAADGGSARQDRMATANGGNGRQDRKAAPARRGGPNVALRAHLRSDVSTP